MNNRSNSTDDIIMNLIEMVERIVSDLRLAGRADRLYRFWKGPVPDVPQVRERRQQISLLRWAARRPAPVEMTGLRESR